MYEYTNRCQGIQQAWNLSGNQNKEVAGYVTTGGGVIVTDIGTYKNSSIAGLYEYDGKSYFQYPVSAGGPLAVNHPGMFVTANRYFIPITATFHTHIPCLQDGTDGVTGSAISPDDKIFAKKYPNTKHYVIGCGAIGQYNNSGSYNIQKGSLTSLCNNIK